MKNFLFLLAVSLFIASCSGEYNGISPEEYIAQNNLDAELLDQGVYIVIKDPGNDKRAELTDVIETDFEGRLANDGTVFSFADDYKYVLGNLLPGWQIGLQEIGEGGSCTLIIPPGAAYGSLDIADIPGKSVLVFDIDLKNIYSETTVEGYVERNNLDTRVLEKGVHVAILESGNEVKPTTSDNIVVSYAGKFTNELEFEKNEQVEFNLGNLIEGWQIGIPELGEGGEGIFVLPAEVAYGASGSGVIPPNTPLVFNITLHDVKLSDVDQYIQENSLTTTELDQGVHIIIHEEGDDNKPDINSTVTVDYSGKLSDGYNFDQNTNFTTAISNVIEGWQIGLQEIGVGGSCTLILPSSAGYGGLEVGSIPPNSILIFDIDLKDVQ